LSSDGSSSEWFTTSEMDEGESGAILT
jgi:hypothetical protein